MKKKENDELGLKYMHKTTTIYVVKY